MAPHAHSVKYRPQLEQRCSPSVEATSYQATRKLLGIKVVEDHPTFSIWQPSTSAFWQLLPASNNCSALWKQSLCLLQQTVSNTTIELQCAIWIVFQVSQSYSLGGSRLIQHCSFCSSFLAVHYTRPSPLLDNEAADYLTFTDKSSSAWGRG